MYAMNERITPVSITRSDARMLRITWSDGKVCEYSMPHLRKNCPCATCQADLAAKGAFYIPLFTADALTLEKVVPQGHYALQFHWKDGHHTGIYDYALLRRLCPRANGEDASA